MVLLMAGPGCSSKMSSDRYREGDNAGQNVELTVDQEKQLTKEALAEMPELIKGNGSVAVTEEFTRMKELAQQFVEGHKNRKSQTSAKNY